MALRHDPDPPWRRLGELLIKRRVDIDHRYRNRRTFCDETRTDYRVVSDVEAARRTNFSQPMISHLEGAYRLRPGNIKRILDGGDLEAEEPVARVAQAAMAVPEAPEPGVQVEQYDDTRVHIGVIVYPGVTMDQAIASLGALSPHEEATIHVLKSMRYDPAEVAGMILVMRGVQQYVAAADPSEGGRGA